MNKATTTKNISVRNIGKRTSSFSLDPRDITVRQGFNGRIKFEGIEELAEDIKINGLMNPLKVRSINNTIELIDGERRLRALLLLAENGTIIDSPVTIVKKEVEEKELLIQQLSCNSGKPFTAYEKSLLYKRIKDAGIKPAEIARRSQTSKQAVSDALRVVEQSSEAIQQAIQDEAISFTLALSIIKENSEHEDQNNILEQTLKNAKEAGKDHASGKHLPKKNAPTVQENKSQPFHWDHILSEDQLEYGLNEREVFTQPNQIHLLQTPKSWGINSIIIHYAPTASGDISYGLDLAHKNGHLGVLPSNSNEPHAKRYPTFQDALIHAESSVRDYLYHNEANYNLTNKNIDDIFDSLNQQFEYRADQSVGSSTNLTHPYWKDIESEDIMSYGLNEENVFTLPNIIEFTDIPPSYKLKDLAISYAWTTAGRVVMSYSCGGNQSMTSVDGGMPYNDEEDSFVDLASALRATVPHICNSLDQHKLDLSESNIANIFNQLNDIAPYKYWTFEKSSKGTGMTIIEDVCKDPCEVLTLSNIPDGHRIEHLVIELSNVFANHSGLSYKSRSRQKNIDCNTKERPAISSRPAAYRSVWEQELEEILRQDCNPVEFAQIKENLNLATHFISAVDKAAPHKKDISEEYKGIKSDEKPLSSGGGNRNSAGNSAGSMENKINNVEKMLEKVSDDPDFKTNDTVYASFELFIDYLNGNYDNTKPLKDLLKLEETFK